MPSSVAASKSIESTPTPIRLTTFSFGHSASTSRDVNGKVFTSAPSASFSRSIISAVVRVEPSSTSKPASSNKSTRLYWFAISATFIGLALSSICPLSTVSPLSTARKNSAYPDYHGRRTKNHSSGDVQPLFLSLVFRWCRVNAKVS